jgi:polysaccharide export outer membrane protein
MLAVRPLAARAQAAVQASNIPANVAPAAPARAGEAAVPADYTIGADDVLTIVIWREPDMSAETVVRPDGKISLPLLDEIPAVGLTPEQLRSAIQERATKFVKDARVSVVVKTINSRRAFITGMVVHPGAYALSSQTTVLQLIAMAGGLLEYADSKNIVITRVEGGRSTALQFNYKDIIARKNLHTNVLLKPGDTVVVP